MDAQRAAELLSSRILLDTRMCSSDEANEWQEAIAVAVEALKSYQTKPKKFRFIRRILGFLGL